MGLMDDKEGLNVPKTNLTEFFDDVEGKLSLLTGLVPYEELGLTLEQVRKPLLVIGLPGVGKTCGIITTIRELNKKLPKEKQLGFKKIMLGQTVVGSLSGIPVVGKDGQVIRVQIPDLPNEERDGKYGVLFLDEITTADEMQIQPALGLADDSRSLGEYTLPENWIVVAAGNGPDCTNFVRLDDMTISRFVVYDVAYDFKTDWRPYAHKTGINPDIIAFLNFSPDTCVRVESTDMDSAGKLFPCPRSWERLSLELATRKARGKEVPYDNLANFAGRIVGKKAGSEFAAFMMFKKTLNYDAEKILAGEEKDPEEGMRGETFHIILQSLIKVTTQMLKETEEPKDSGNYPLESYQKVANMFKWLLKIDSLEFRVNSIFEIKNDVPPIADIVFDEDFIMLCPEFDEFFGNYSTLITNNHAELQNMVN